VAVEAVVALLMPIYPILVVLAVVALAVLLLALAMVQVEPSAKEVVAETVLLLMSVEMHKPLVAAVGLVAWVRTQLAL
jgi:membrane-bound ClpP family serine protease